MYKSGYTKGLKVPKSERASESTSFEQEGYYTFGFKAFAAEKMPLSHRAKGFRERTIEMPCIFGLPEYIFRMFLIMQMIQSTMRC